MKIMKGFFPIAVVGLLLSLGACTGPNDGGKSGQSTTSSVAPLPRITVKTADDKTSLTLIVGETGQVKADQEGVTWASTNAAVATVENGVVTAVAPGSAKITASKDGFKTGELNVTVNRKPPIATLRTPGHLIPIRHHAVGHTSGAVELRRDIELPLLKWRDVTHRHQSLELVLQRFLAQLVVTCGGVQRGLPYIVVTEGCGDCPAAKHLHRCLYLRRVTERACARYVAHVI